jgi:hypothetical protein
MYDSLVTAHEDGASAAVGHGEQGYLIIHSDGRSQVGFGGEKVHWKFRILDTYGDVLTAKGGYEDEIHSPEFTTSMEALGSLVSFLLACAESRSEDSENYSLFPTEIREWAEMCSDELQMVALAIEESVLS